MLLEIVMYLNIILALFLIFFILVNKGKDVNTDGFSTFSTNDVFGSKGSNSFLNKIITLIAVFLLLLNFSINFLNSDLLKKEAIPVVNVDEYKTDIKNVENI